MPDAGRRFADKGLQRVCILEDLLQGEVLHDEFLDQQTPQGSWSVEQFRDKIRHHLVLGVDDTNLSDLVAIARRERIADRVLQRGIEMQCRELAKSFHQSLQIARVGKKVEIHRGFVAPIRGGKFDVARFGKGFIDEDQQRGDLLTNRVPGRFPAGNYEHVARGRATNFGRVPVAHQNVPPRIFVEPGLRMQEGCDRNGRVIH